MNILVVLLLTFGIFQFVSAVPLDGYSEYCTYCDEKNTPKCASEDAHNNSVTIDCSTSAQSCLLMLVHNTENDGNICISMKQANAKEDVVELKEFSTAPSVFSKSLQTPNIAIDKQTIEDANPTNDNIKELSVTITDAKINKMKGHDEDKKEDITSNGKLEEYLTTTTATTSILHDINATEINMKPTVPDDKTNNGMATIEATHNTETVKNHDEKPTNSMDYVADEPQQAVASSGLASSEKPVSDTNKQHDNNNEIENIAKASTTTMQPEAVTMSNHAVVPKVTTMPTALRCYTCTSIEDKNCKKKPTNFIDCNPIAGKDSGCYTLIKDNSTLIARGCISNLSGDDMMYCKNNTHHCVLCNKELCNKLDAPSKAVLNARIYWVLMLLTLLPIMHGYGN